jgi:peroxiredoxin Q/BCP
LISYRTPDDRVVPTEALAAESLQKMDGRKAIPMIGKPVEIGAKVEDFELPIDDGDVFRLSGYAGKPVVVFFYPKDDTTGCTAEAKDFTRLAGDFRSAGIAVLGISPDSIKKHQKFKAKHALDVSLAADEDHAVAERFGVWVEKSMYGRKYMGIERSTFLIDGRGRLAQAWRKVSVPGHADAVLDAARALQIK